MSERPSFFAELKRPNVYKVAVAYAVVGWFVTQIAAQICRSLEVPNRTIRLVIVVICIGFPRFKTIINKIFPRDAEEIPKSSP